VAPSRGAGPAGGGHDSQATTLGADMAGPWAEWKNGKPITQAQLARVLKSFGIAPIKIRLASGYRVTCDGSSRERYL
jgi:Protein of unknown function (DUF3631)